MKRLVVISLLFLGAAGSSAPIGAPAFAQARQSWDGTWAGGWSDKSGAQIIFAGDEFIGIYWRDDYIGDAKGAVSRERRDGDDQMVARRSRLDPRGPDERPRDGARGRPPRGFVRVEEGLSGPGAQFSADHICGWTAPKKSHAHKAKSATRNPA